MSTNKSSNGTAGERGTVLGLILSKYFVERLGGQIWIECTEGRGRIFLYCTQSINVLLCIESSAWQVLLIPSGSETVRYRMENGGGE